MVEGNQGKLKDAIASIVKEQMPDITSSVLLVNGAEFEKITSEVERVYSFN